MLGWRKRELTKENFKKQATEEDEAKEDHMIWPKTTNNYEQIYSTM